ncbi:MAG: pyridoxamine 5'-phosphate oxidase family protein [Euryarchaeota archaeon]|nr:pyridoxamine 5'-phosphate oxidase family protein [Euryarchaeota archaeon]
MDKITDDVKNVLEKIQWGSVATASKDGVPNVSPKSSFKIVDEKTIQFADIFSEHTRRNLMENQKVAIDIVDAETASGYQLKGTATLADSGPEFEEAKEELAEMGFPAPKNLVTVTVTEVYSIKPGGS